MRVKKKTKIEDFYKNEIENEIFYDYINFRSTNGETFNTENNKKAQKTDNFWEEIYKSYKEITIKLEELKQYGNLKDIKNFEKDLIIFFDERVLNIALNKNLIDKKEADKDKPYFNEDINQYYNYFGVDLSEDEMREAKRLFNLEQNFYKKSTKWQIYDLYCKSLRRIGNLYKKYGEFLLALNIFLKIEEFGHKGILDGKNIIKCQKELEIRNKKLLKK